MRVIIFIHLLILICGSTVVSQEEITDDKYNVLFIMVDDLRPELNCYGAEQIVSPNIDKLAQEGYLFENAFVNFPVCGPSRSSMLSGLYPGRERFRNNNWDQSVSSLLPGLTTLPDHFKNNGYKTLSIGKVFSDIKDSKDVWDYVWKPKPTKTLVWDYQTPEGVESFWSNNKDYGKVERKLPRRGVAFEKADVPDTAYVDGRITQRAIDKLNELQGSKNPFFMAVGFIKPHLPFNSPSKYWEMYDRKEIEVASNGYPPENAPKYAMHNFQELREYEGIPKEGRIEDELAILLKHAYFSAVSYIDEQIGTLLRELERLDMRKNTIIVLWGDHGWQLGEHDLWSKHASFKTSLQIPLIFTLPPNSATHRINDLVESVDIYPTLCDLVGIAKPFHLQGKSFSKLFSEKTYEHKKYIFARTHTGGETIITPNFTYTEFYNKKNEYVGNMLYDLTEDPDENINVANDPRYEADIEKLEIELHKYLMQRDQLTLSN